MEGNVDKNIDPYENICTY